MKRLFYVPFTAMAVLVLAAYLFLVVTWRFLVALATNFRLFSQKGGKKTFSELVAYSFENTIGNMKTIRPPPTWVFRFMYRSGWYNDSTPEDDFVQEVKESWP